MNAEKLKPRRAELEIFNVLWQEETDAVRAINDIKPTGYTTVLELSRL
jgi:hypothetical protein